VQLSTLRSKVIDHGNPVFSLRSFAGAAADRRQHQHQQQQQQQQQQQHPLSSNPRGESICFLSNDVSPSVKKKAIRPDGPKALERTQRHFSTIQLEQFFGTTVYWTSFKQRTSDQCSLNAQRKHA
jgi:hypothetical protein